MFLRGKGEISASSGRLHERLIPAQNGQSSNAGRATFCFQDGSCVRSDKIVKAMLMERMKKVELRFQGAETMGTTN